MIEKKKNKLNALRFICKICGKKVYNHNANGRWVYCSERCRKRAAASRRRGMLTCSYCNKQYSPFHTYWYRKYKNGKHSFCSQKHYWKFRYNNPGLYYKTLNLHTNILELKEKGMSYKELSEHFGMTKLAIGNALIKIRRYKLKNKLQKTEN